MTVAQLIDNPFLGVIALLTLIFGSGRLTRVIVHDAFPPSIAVRMAWDRLVPEDNPWNKLLHCWWCMSMWVTTFAIGWFLLGQIPGWEWVNVLWWLVWGALAASYAAAILIARDEPAA